MPIIVLIAICLVLQLSVYLYLDRKKLSRWKYLLLIVLLVLNCFVFPGFYYPEISPEAGMACGLAIVPIYFAFIVFGAGGAVVLHLIYWLIRKIIRRYHIGKLKNL